MLFSDYLFREAWVGVCIRFCGNGYLWFRSYSGSLLEERQK